MLIPISYLYVTRHPTEPQCSYDPVEGLTLAPETDPMDRIKSLEDQIGKTNLVGSDNLDAKTIS